MINWWFGSRWFGFLGSLKMKGIVLKRVHQPNPNHQFTNKLVDPTTTQICPTKWIIRLNCWMSQKNPGVKTTMPSVWRMISMSSMIRARCTLKSVAAFRCVDGSFEGSLNTLCILVSCGFFRNVIFCKSTILWFRSRCFLSWHHKWCQPKRES